MTSRRVLLTGATGVIGRRVIPLLAARGYSVTAVGGTPMARTELAAMGADPIALDLFDEEAARRAMAGHAVVINQSAAADAPARGRSAIPNGPLPRASPAAD
jgi:nucleoside-diphosphate-sugar epimerase